MKPGRSTFALFIVLVLLFVFIYKRWQEPGRKESFNRHPDKLYFTKHASCRMDCRHISREDIEEIMEKGVINYNKSKKYDRPCPTFAVQGTTDEGEHLRVIFAQCRNETKIVTCYNLDEDFTCNCP